MDPINDDKMVSIAAKAVKQAGELVPPTYLLDKIMAAILKRQTRMARFWLAANSLLTALVLGLIIYLSPQVYSQFVHSSSGSTLSLLWSDFGYVAVNWADFSWLVLESLPISAMLLGLSALLSLLFLARSLVQNLDRTHYHYHFKVQ